MFLAFGKTAVIQIAEKLKQDLAETSMMGERSKPYHLEKF
jgi:hypothetical protein